MNLPYIPQRPSAYECTLLNEAETVIQKPLAEIVEGYTGDFQTLYFFTYLYNLILFFKFYGTMPYSFEQLRSFMFWQA